MSLQPSVHDAMLGAVPQLRAIAMKLCRNVDQADDLVQETIARGCNNIALFEPGTNMVAWLTTILRNHFLSECRRASYRLSDAIEDHVETLSIPAAQFASVEAQELRAALHELPEPERVALVMVLGAGYEYEEVARTLRCPTGTVKSRVSRGRRKILSRLAGDAGATSVPAAFH